MSTLRTSRTAAFWRPRRESAPRQASWDPEGPACVAIDLAIQLIGAAQLGDVPEVCGVVSIRTRDLVFTSAWAEVAGKPNFVATSMEKVAVKQTEGK